MSNVTMLPAAVRAGFVRRIRGAMAKSVAGFIEAGLELAKAKSELEPAEFEAMTKDDLKLGRTTVFKLMTIASHPVVSDSLHAERLPPSWTTMYELTRLPQTLLLAKLESGEINQATERKHVTQLLKDKDRREDEAEGDKEDDSPDDGQYDPEAGADDVLAACELARTIADRILERTETADEATVAAVKAVIQAWAALLLRMEELIEEV